jgi:3'-phosphoadenosine 5'-phosphosulfate sulfotransferase (PAPS reductase)/FAD synthetase
LTFRKESVVILYLFWQSFRQAQIPHIRRSIAMLVTPFP